MDYLTTNGLAIIFIPISLGIKEDIILKQIIPEEFYILEHEDLDLQKVASLFCITDEVKERSKLYAGGRITAVVVFDCFPIAVNEKKKHLYRQVDNARLLFNVKYGTSLDGRLFPDQQKVQLCSTGSSKEACHFINTFLPNEVSAIKFKITKIKQLLSSDYPVKKRLSYGLERRAKVELIEYKGASAVQKTFRPGCYSYLVKEVFVMKDLGQACSVIPPLLEQGQGCFIYPYYEDTFKFKSDSYQKIPLEIARQIFKGLYYFYDHGYSLIDFYPENIILDKKEGLKIIDFEFLYAYKVKPASFAQCYDIAGIPPDFDGARPLLGRKRKNNPRNYKTDWQPYIGLELDDFLKQLQFVTH